MSQISLEELKALLQAPTNIIITTHKSPDGDAIGSSLALYHFLIQLNHTVTIITPNAVPASLYWMPGVETIIDAEKNSVPAANKINAAQIIFTLDFNDLSRIDQLADIVANTNAIKVMIDHHLQPAGYAQYMLSDTTASSTCELIYVFIEMLSMKNYLNETIGTCIYTGVLTDTGSFKFYSCTTRTHTVIAALLVLGVKNQAIHEYIFDTNSISRAKLQGHAAANNMFKIKELPVMVNFLTQQELDKFSYTAGDTEGIVNMALGIQGIKVSAFFVERDMQIKMSFRSKGSFNVNEFARKYFNGGGHANAAGGASNKSLQETIKDFENIIATHSNQLL